MKVLINFLHVSGRFDQEEVVDHVYGFQSGWLVINVTVFTVYVSIKEWLLQTAVWPYITQDIKIFWSGSVVLLMIGR